MTTRSNIGRYYDQLTPHERFKLSLLAEARGDTAEAERLTASCPRKTYTMNEAGFTERWQAAFALVSGLAGATGVHFGWLAAIDALAEPMGECIRGLLKESGEPPAAYTPRSFEIGRRTFAGQIKTLWEAFAVVCREHLELEPEIVVTAFYPALLERLEEYRDLIDVAAVDGEFFEQYREQYVQVWRQATRVV